MTDRKLQAGKIAVVLHRAPGSAGAIGQWLADAGYGLDIFRPKFGDRLPDNLEGYSGAIIFGGPNSANDEEEFIVSEIDWIGRVLDAQTPFLGVCLGGQMLAKFLGGQIAPHPDGFVERGYYKIRPTADAQSLGGEWPEEVYQWHQEGFELPNSAKALAVAHGPFPNQAFSYNGNAVGLQFHPEITYMMINRWSRRASQLAVPGAQLRQAQFEAHFAMGPNVKDWLSRFLPDWLNSGKQSPKDG